MTFAVWAPYHDDRHRFGSGGAEHIDVDCHTVAQRNGHVFFKYDVCRQRPKLGCDLVARLRGAIFYRPVGSPPPRSGSLPRMLESMLVGIVTFGRIIAVPTLVAADTEKLVALVGPAIQQILVP